MKENKMKYVASIVVFFVFSAASVLAAEEKWTGQVGDSMCGLEAKHSLGPDGKPMSARDCARDCVKQGGSYVLISQGKVFKLVNGDKATVSANAGYTVDVVGTLRGDAITVSKITRSTKQ
jgi:hypothetical protein